MERMCSVPDNATDSGPTVPICRVLDRRKWTSNNTFHRCHHSLHILPIQSRYYVMLIGIYPNAVYAHFYSYERILLSFASKTYKESESVLLHIIVHSPLLVQTYNTGSSTLMLLAFLNFQIASKVGLYFRKIHHSSLVRVFDLSFRS